LMSSGGFRNPGSNRLFTLVSTQHLDYLLADSVQIGAEFYQHLRGYTLTLTNQTHQEMLGTDVIVSKLQGLTKTHLEHLLGTRGEWNVTGWRLLPLTNQIFNLLTYLFE